MPLALHRLRYSTESGTPSISVFGEAKSEAKYFYHQGPDSIRTAERIMVVSPVKSGGKRSKKPKAMSKIEIDLLGL